MPNLHQTNIYYHWHIGSVNTTRKYELKIEFQHHDDAGLQWISIAKANKQSVKSIFEQQVIKIQKSIT